MRFPTLSAGAAMLTLTLFSHTFSQSSLFNIPTPDVLERGETFLEADFDARFSRSRENRWQSYGVMAIRGVEKRFEVGVNAYGVRSHDGFEPVEIQPNVKWKVFESERNGFSVAAGAIGYFPLKKKFSQVASLSVYAVAGKEFASDWAPRITGGAYQLLGATPDGTDSRGFFVGIEQPLFKSTTLMADWNSGKNRLGYAAAGFGVELTKRSSIYSAYYFGNEGRGNNFLGVYYARNLLVGNYA